MVKTFLLIFCRVATWALAAASAAAYVLACFMKDSNPHIQQVWKLSAICGFLAFLAETYVAKEEKRNSDLVQKKHQDHIIELKSTLDETKSKVSSIMPRRISADQKNRIIQQIAKFPFSKISVRFTTGDSEASGYATDFAMMFKEAAWNVSCSSVNEFMRNESVFLVMNDKDVHSKTCNIAHITLICVLMNEGLSPHEVTTHSQVDSGHMELRIGPNLGQQPVPLAPEKRFAIDLSTRPDGTVQATILPIAF